MKMKKGSKLDKETTNQYTGLSSLATFNIYFSATIPQN
jgi:hypothetical protein